MIPLSLTLQNFLSYGQTPQTISFQGHHLICLSGKNGHGKSALLDAITWSLWGQARKTTGVSKPDDNLVRLGAGRMLVIFECIAKSKRYRVRREYIKNAKKPYLTLDFSVWDEQLNDYRSLTEKTIKKTQAIIEGCIGLTFDTYVNSVFLRQGNANEFSQKSARDRKKILTSVLGIDAYDSLQAKAMEEARLRNNEKEKLYALCQHDEEICAKSTELSHQHAQLEEQLMLYAHQLQSLEKEQTDAQAQMSQYQSRITFYQEEQTRHTQRRKEYERDSSEWKEKAQQWRKEHADFLVNKSHVLTKEARDAVRRDVQSLQERSVHYMNYTTQLHELEAAYAKRYQELERIYQKHIQEKEQELSRVTSECAVMEQRFLQWESDKGRYRTAEEKLTKQMTVSTTRIQELRQLLASYEKQKALFEKRKQAYDRFRHEGKLLANELQEYETRFAFMNQQDTASCPLCEQLLTKSRKTFLAQKLYKDRSWIEHRFMRLKKLVTTLKDLLQEQHIALQKEETYQTELITLQAEQESYKQHYLKGKQELQEGEKHFVHLQSEYALLLTKKTHLEEELALLHNTKEKHITQHEDIAHLHEERSVVSKKREHLQFDQAIYQAAQEKYKQVLALEEEEQLRERKQQTLYNIRRELHYQYAHLIKERKLLAQSVFPTEEMEHYQKLYSALKNEQDERIKKQKALQLERESLLTQQGRCKQLLDEIVQRQEALKKRKKQLQLLEQDIQDHLFLSQMWSKNGLQALLIEDALPELEQEANDLLSRLTNNQASIMIESLRDLKKGGARETLDITISDAAGVRPYELFSGGEAFRIDFAIRIAISKLLARRSGTTLQVLIIDEGFGSQDEEGLQRLMAALYTVQEDFEKIIIVSHLPSFKENFPVHFIVEKTPSGSMVYIEERG